MDYRRIIIIQYQAALEMLRQAIMQCPAALWDDPADKTRFWQIAYHALFYTHLYVQESEQSFVPWSKHRAEYESLGGQTSIAAPFDQAMLLEYLALCQQQMVERLADTHLEDASGFFWLPLTKFELQIYSIRHLQQHIGELMERLGSRANIDIAWVGSQPS